MFRASFDKIYVLDEEEAQEIKSIVEEIKNKDKTDVIAQKSEK